MQLSKVPQPIIDKANFANENLNKTEKQPNKPTKVKDDIEERLAQLA
jgi:hypothetical protein